MIADSTTTGIDAALTAGGQISGTVTDAVTKAPLAGAEVCAYNQSEEFLGFFNRCTDTNSAGQYTFSGLAGGEYKVYFAFGSYAPQYYNDKSELSEAEPVHVTAGSTTSGIDAALQPTVGQISGKVTNASTLAAVEGVYVCALTSADEDQRLHEHGLGWYVHAHGASSWRIPGRVHRTGSSELRAAVLRRQDEVRRSHRRVGDRGFHDDGYRRGADGRRADHRHRHRRRNESPTRGCRGVRL